MRRAIIERDLSLRYMVQDIAAYARWSDQIVRGRRIKYSLASIELTCLFFMIGSVARKIRAH